MHCMIASTGETIQAQEHWMSLVLLIDCPHDAALVLLIMIACPHTACHSCCQAATTCTCMDCLWLPAPAGVEQKLFCVKQLILSAVN